MHVLLGDVRVMPHHLFLEPPCRGVIVGLAHVNPYDAFERLQHRAGTNTLERIGPLRSLSQIHCIVISVGESESQCQSFGRLDSQRIDQLLAKQAHRRGAENHDALFVQPNDALIRPKIEQFSQMQVLLFRRRVATGLRFHDTSILRRLAHYAVRQHWPPNCGLTEWPRRKARQSLRAVLELPARKEAQSTEPQMVPSS